MDSLPANVLEKILSFLNGRDLVSATGVDTVWFDIINKDLKDMAILRYKNQKLPENYCFLFICRPVSKSQFDHLMHDDVRLLEIRMDQGNGVEKRWRKSELRKIFEKIFRLYTLMELNLIDVGFDRLPFFQLDSIIAYPSIRLINRTKYEIDIDTFPSLLWEKRTLFPEMILINETSYYGYFKNCTSIMAERLLEGKIEVKLEGDFSNLLKSYSIEDLTIFVKRDIDGIVMMDDAFDNLPNLNRLAIITSDNLRINLKTISMMNFRHLKELSLSYSNCSNFTKYNLILNYFETFDKHDLISKEVIKDESISRIDIRTNCQNIFLLKKLTSPINQHWNTIGLHFYNEIDQIIKCLRCRDNPLLELFNPSIKNRNLILYFHF